MSASHGEVQDYRAPMLAGQMLKDQGARASRYVPDRMQMRSNRGFHLVARLTNVVVLLALSCGAVACGVSPSPDSPEPSSISSQIELSPVPQHETQYTPPNLRLERLTREDGLSSNTVRCLLSEHRTSKLEASAKRTTRFPTIVGAKSANVKNVYGMRWRRGRRRAPGAHATRVIGATALAHLQCSGPLETWAGSHLSQACNGSVTMPLTSGCYTVHGEAQTATPKGAVN